MNKITDRLTPICFLLCFSVVLFLQSCNSEEKPSPTPAQAAAPPSSAPPPAVPVQGFVVQARTLEKAIGATGSLIAYEAVDIRPERSGKLMQLNFNESSFVKEGKVLAKIDDKQLLAERKRLEVSLDLAHKEVERGKELLQIQGVSAEEMDRLTNRVEAIKAEMAVIDVQIEKSTIIAPFSGVVGLRQKSPGAYVTPNDIIVDLKQINPLKLEFEVAEKYINQVAANQSLTFTVVGFDQTFNAKVYATDSEIAPSTRTFRVRATCANPGNRLKPGQFAKVNLVTGKNQQAVMVPTDAVIPVLEGKQLFVYKGGKAIATKVTVEDRRAQFVEITKGVSIGDTIIVSGLMSLTDNTPVSIQTLVNLENESAE